jgi:hypothetical protein
MEHQGSGGGFSFTLWQAHGSIWRTGRFYTDDRVKMYHKQNLLWFRPGGQCADHVGDNRMTVF